MPTFQDFLNQGLGAFFPASPQGATTFGLPRGLEQLGGAASLIAGLRDQPTVTIPEYQSFASPEGTAAKGFLRRGFESPADPLAAGGIFERYLPAFEREEQRSLDQLQQIYGAAFPASAGMQGSATEALRRASGEFAQNRQKLIADLTRENQERQRLMATSLAGLEGTGQFAGFEAALIAAMQSAEAERQRNANLAALGLMLLTDRQGNQQIVNVGGQTTTVGGAGGTGPGGAIQSLSDLVLRPGGGAGGVLEGDGLALLIQDIVRSVGQAGGSLVDVAAKVAQTAGQAGLDMLSRVIAGQGALGPAGIISLQGLLSSAGSAGGGFLAGRELGRMASSGTSEERKIADFFGGPITAFNLGGPSLQLSLIHI